MFSVDDHSYEPTCYLDAGDPHMCPANLNPFSMPKIPEIKHLPNTSHGCPNYTPIQNAFGLVHLHLVTWDTCHHPNPNLDSSDGSNCFFPIPMERLSKFCSLRIPHAVLLILTLLRHGWGEVSSIHHWHVLFQSALCAAGKVILAMFQHWHPVGCSPADTTSCVSPLGISLREKDGTHYSHRHIDASVNSSRREQRQKNNTPVISTFLSSLISSPTCSSGHLHSSSMNL